MLPNTKAEPPAATLKPQPPRARPPARPTRPPGDKRSAQQITDMAKVSYNLPHMWNHAIGPDWKDKLTHKDIEAMFRRL